MKSKDGKKIKKKLDMVGIKHNFLAKKFNIHKSTLSKFLNGKLDLPKKYVKQMEEMINRIDQIKL